MILYQVVDESTVCLMGHERRQTLALIQDLSCQVFVPEYYQDQTPGSGYCSPGSTSQGNWSSASSTSGQSSNWSSSNSSSSHINWSSKGSLSGQYSPMSTSSTCSPSLSPKPAEVPDHPPPPPVVPHKFTVPPPPHPVPPPPGPPAPPPPACPPPPLTVHHSGVPASQQQNIPTYEIVTSCQPSVMYSNGYYYTSFVPPPNATNSNFVNTTTVTQTLGVPTTGGCYSCACGQAPPTQWVSSVPLQQGS